MEKCCCVMPSGNYFLHIFKGISSSFSDEKYFSTGDVKGLLVLPIITRCLPETSFNYLVTWKLKD